RAGDPAALAILRVDGAMQQRFALLLALLQAPGEPPRQRQRREPQQEQRADQRQHDRLRLALPAFGDRAEAGVRLEQERSVARPADWQVDLEQLLVVAFEAVLGTREVGDFGVRTPSSQRRELLAAERVTPADQTRLV